MSPTLRRSPHRFVLAVLPVVASACSGAPSVDISDPSPPPSGQHDAGTDIDASGLSCPELEGVYAAKRSKRNVLFLLDRSGSMHIRLSNLDTRWTATRKGVRDLLTTLGPSARGGAMMFPQGDRPVTCCSIDPRINDVACTCSAHDLPGVHPRCDLATYQAAISVGDLDAPKASAIDDYFATADDEFYWGTPLATALDAAIGSMRSLPLDGPKSVVLLTDGYPSSCETTNDPSANDIARVVASAAAGVSGQAPVRTFVLGVMDGTKGARAEYVSAIASAGGTGRTPTCAATNDCHYAVNAGAFAHDLSVALDAIAVDAFDCTLSLPEARPGSANDLSKVNVVVRSSGASQLYARDTSRQSGWDYLPGNTQIQLYGAACTTLRVANLVHGVSPFASCSARFIPRSRASSVHLPLSLW